MPIKIRKVKNYDTYKVYNSETGEIHSHNTTKDNAIKQKHLLDNIDNNFFGGNLFTSMKNRVTNTIKTTAKTVDAVINGRSDYSPSVRDFYRNMAMKL